MIFDAYYKNEVGVWYFFPEDTAAYAERRSCRGFGSIKYDEGSVYTGEIYFDGKNYEKLGAGQQDFSYSSLGIYVTASDRLYKYVGQFDYRQTQWICGNGVMYFTDRHGNPTHFTLGNWRALKKAGEFEGEFDYSLLLDGYNRKMEWDIIPDGQFVAFNKKLKKLTQTAAIDVLYIGDSYFGLWDDRKYSGTPFSMQFRQGHFNFGINGTTFADWLEFFGRIEKTPVPEKIIINLGFNDLHHGRDVEATYADFQKFISVLKGRYPSARVYLDSVVHSPRYAAMYADECRLNGLTARTDGITVIDTCSFIEKAQKSKNCFYSDNLHLNSKGYKIMGNAIKSAISGEDK